jgi:hypothetical protein
VTLSATHGTLTLSQLTGLTFTVGDGTADATMTFTGTMANINAALNGLTYAPTADYNGAATCRSRPTTWATPGWAGRWRTPIRWRSRLTRSTTRPCWRAPTI